MTTKTTKTAVPATPAYKSITAESIDLLNTTILAAFRHEDHDANIVMLASALATAWYVIHDYGTGGPPGRLSYDYFRAWAAYTERTPREIGLVIGDRSHTVFKRLAEQCPGAIQFTGTDRARVCEWADIVDPNILIRTLASEEADAELAESVSRAERDRKPADNFYTAWEEETESGTADAEAKSAA